MSRTDAIALICWLVLGPIAALITTWLAGRLLGARRGWLPLVVSGSLGWTLGVVIAGVLTDWSWAELQMGLIALGAATIMTMVAALGLDLLAPMGTLAQGAEADVITLHNPLSRLRNDFAAARRYRKVMAIARANGLLGRRIDHAALPQELRATLEQAGGIFVKVGQVASTRTDVLPIAWCDELAKLRSSAEPAPRSVVEPAVVADIGEPVDRAFVSFDWTPIASASIAQVYAARLKDDTDDEILEVVVKVQRPGLEELVAVDSSAILKLAGLIQRRTLLGLAMRPQELAEEFLGGVREELDLRIEAANIKELSAALDGYDGVRLPRLAEELSSEYILVEERVDGVEITDLDALRTGGHDPAELAHRLLQVFLFQIFEIGIFHADPHPGNLLVSDDGTITMIDLGAVGHLGATQRTATLEILAAASAGDAVAARQAIERIVPIDSSVDTRALDFAISEVLGKYDRAGSGISTEALQDLVAVMGHFGIRPPAWIGTLSRTLITLEGTLRSIDADFSLVDEAHAAAERSGAIPSLDAAGLKATVEREAMTQLPRLRRVPERLDDLLGQAVSGRFRISLSMFDDPNDERVTTRLVNRIVTTLIAAALGLGSVGLLSIEHGPGLGTTSLNQVLGYAGLAGAAVLSLRVVASVLRDGST